MPCPLCGDICRCSSAGDSALSSHRLPDVDPHPTAASLEAPPEPPSASQLAEATTPDDGSPLSPPEDSTAWRQELAARLNRYQAKRKPRPPRYPSLRLPFEQQESALDATLISDESSAFPQRTTSRHALALDSFADSAAHPVETQLSPALPHANDSSQQPTLPTAKIIEFPRSWTPPPAPLDQLAEPVMDRPRILEAPEFTPPPPALGGITIESAQQPALEKRPGIDIPLQSAPLARRILSAAIDDVIIASACALFGFIFWKMTAIQPPRFQIVGLAAGFGGTFWAVYQYLLIVYSATTPGLRLAGLELARFDGTSASRRLRRCRVLASYLSAVSLGMGYAWVFLDEDALCWHDRITHTYLAPRG